jgi:hypothetical protein
LEEATVIVGSAGEEVGAGSVDALGDRHG